MKHSRSNRNCQLTETLCFHQEVCFYDQISLILFSSRMDNLPHPDLFAREASIIGETQKPKFLVLDRCVFDIRKNNSQNLSIH